MHLTTQSINDTSLGANFPLPETLPFEFPDLNTAAPLADFDGYVDLESRTEDLIPALLEVRNSQTSIAVSYGETSNGVTIAHTATSSDAGPPYLQLLKGVGVFDEQDQQANEANLAPKVVRRLRLQNTEDNIGIIRVAIEDRYTMRQIFLAGLKALGNHDSLGDMPLPSCRSSSPSFYRNNLSLVSPSTLRAYLANAELLGISIPELYRDNCTSPFHQPHFSPLDNGDSVLARLSNGITPHLRPTRAQLFYSHPPWPDLMPFSDFT